MSVQTSSTRSSPDGTLKWSYDTGDYINGPAAIGDNGTIYFPSLNYLYALNPDGTLKWRSPGRADYPLGSAPAIGEDGTIYINTHNGVLHAFRHNGAFAWKFSTPGIVMDVPSSPAIGADGTVYFGGAGEYQGRGGYFYALNPAGSLKWKYFAGCDQTAPSIGGDGTIYFGTNDCHAIRALNPDGTLKWCYGKSLGAYMRSAPAIGREGRLYTAFLVDPVYLPKGGLLAFGPRKDSPPGPGKNPRTTLQTGCESPLPQAARTNARSLRTWAARRPPALQPIPLAPR
jgi:outer membrane protein assembly factor BamB